LDSHSHERAMKSRGWVTNKGWVANKETTTNQKEPITLDSALYEALLMRLNDLIASGRGDTDEADSVRDQMLDLWRRLPSAELLVIEQREARRIRNVTF